MFCLLMLIVLPSHYFLTDLTKMHACCTIVGGQGVLEILSCGSEAGKFGNQWPRRFSVWAAIPYWPTGGSPNSWGNLKQGKKMWFSVKLKHTSGPAYRIKVPPQRASLDQLRPWAAHLTTPAQIYGVQVMEKPQHNFCRELGDVGWILALFQI